MRHAGQSPPPRRQALEAHANEILARLLARTGLALEVQRALAPRVAGRR